MSTAVFDSSLLTLRRQQQALATFRSQLAAAAIENPNQVRSLSAGQNGNPSQVVIINANIGCSVCNSFTNTMGNNRNSGCSCTATNTF